MSGAAWLHRLSEGAPPALRDRAARHLAHTPGDADPSDHLAAAGRVALEAALTSSGGRAAALDLLAADALVTLALLVKALTDPAGLGALAGRIRLDGAGTP